MEVEKKHMEKYFSMGVVMNGPQISFVRFEGASPCLLRNLRERRMGVRG